MTSTAIFRPWAPGDAERFANEPLRLEHTLHQHPLFSIEALADLIDAYPRQHLSLVHMGGRGDRRLWEEGDLGDLSGREVITAVEQGRMWLNLRRIGDADARYRHVLDQLFAEIEARVPGVKTFDRSSGLLLSSPSAQVYYHSDLPGQSLWQLHGRKRVYLYPCHEPFLSPEQLENIALYEVEVDMKYEPWFDEHAIAFDLEPGQMLHWPLNAPHRVENLGVFNVSMTTEYWTDDIRRRQMLNMANGILRHKLGWKPRSRATSGAAFWGKVAMQAAYRRAGLLNTARKSRRPITFRLDRRVPDCIAPIGAPAE